MGCNNYWNFFGFFFELFFEIFWEFFWRIFLAELFCGIVLEEFFWRIFLGEYFWDGFFWEDFIGTIFWEGIFCGRNSLSQWRRRKNKKFRSLEVRRKLIALTKWEIFFKFCGLLTIS